MPDLPDIAKSDVDVREVGSVKTDGYSPYVVGKSYVEA